MELEGLDSDSRGQVNSVWNVPAPFCAMRFINDQRYSEGDWKRPESGGLGAKKPNVQFRAPKNSVSRGF